MIIHFDLIDMMWMIIGVAGGYLDSKIGKYIYKKIKNRKNPYKI